MMWPTSSNDPNQWSFNPAVYQNVPYEQVDWATLAQQWIKMKETLPSASPGPPPPPAPQISKPKETQPPKSTPAASEPRFTNDIEGGEAPMDMDTNDDDVLPAVGVATDSSWKQWNDWQSQYGWGWPRNAGTVTLGEKITTTASTVDSKVKSQSNDSNPVLNNYVSNVGTFPNNKGTNSTQQVPGSINYNKVAGGMIPPTHPKSDYWSENSYTASGRSTGSKSANKANNQKTIADQFPTMDAAKKKQLPAWIREGLNKMEREKQKKMEYERMAQERLMRDQISPEKSFKNDIFPGNDETPTSSPPIAEKVEPFLDRFEKDPSPDKLEPPRFQRSSTAVENTEVIRKTKDQIMEESMLKVRRILTEFLLEATENEVTAIAKEELRKRKSASAPQIRKSNALTSLTGNLGLAVYDSDSESSDSERENNDRNNIDSDEELEMLIEKKKRDFTLIEDQIEEEIENQEFKERQIVQRDQKLENDEESRNSDFRERETDNDHSQEREPHSEGDARDDKRAEKPSLIANEKTSNNKREKSSKNSKLKKEKRRARSSSTSSSSSDSSSASSSSHSSSDRSRSRSDSGSSSSRHSNSKKKGKKKSQKRSDSTTKSSKRSKHRSKSRSTSRSRYSRNEERRKDSRDRRERSKERKRTHDYRKTSEKDSYHSRSSSYRRDSKDSSSSSKYKDSRKPEPSDSRGKRRRSSSVDSRYSRYKRR